ncbi:hypothetical protein [Pseudomonas syringae]|uniref:hypothetical protein n=1 Tax=Pseudomonas syringae TaxID=317 RepID=UPI0009B17D58|nr:hypothetical protein [Pseudomonas syringae]
MYRPFREQVRSHALRAEAHSAESSETMHAMSALRGNACLVMKLRIKQHPRIFNRINPIRSE